MRLIRGNNHQQWKVMVKKLIDAEEKHDTEMDTANECLRIAETIGGYKDELINVTETLLKYKDWMIAQLMEERRNDK